MKDGHAVSRVADYIIYSVEAEYIDAVVAQYGPCARFPSPLNHLDPTLLT